MKKIVLIVSTVFTITVTKAQTANPAEAPVAIRQTPSAEAQAKTQVEKLNQLVTLTDVQKPKVMELTMAQVKATNELRAKKVVEGEDPSEKRKEIRKIKTDYMLKLKTVLTPEQFAKIDEQAKTRTNGAKSESEKTNAKPVITNSIIY